MDVVTPGANQANRFSSGWRIFMNLNAVSIPIVAQHNIANWCQNLNQEKVDMTQKVLAGQMQNNPY